MLRTCDELRREIETQRDRRSTLSEAGVRVGKSLGAVPSWPRSWEAPAG